MKSSDYHGLAPLDVLEKLRTAMKSSFINILTVDLLSHAAREIATLREDVRRLKAEKSPTDQRATGYAEAQRDIRRALGIDD